MEFENTSEFLHFLSEDKLLPARNRSQIFPYLFQMLYQAGRNVIIKTDRYLSADNNIFVTLY